MFLFPSFPVTPLGLALVTGNYNSRELERLCTELCARALAALHLK